jgi:hypothetical protein
MVTIIFLGSKTNFFFTLNTIRSPNLTLSSKRQTLDMCQLKWHPASNSHYFYDYRHNYFTKSLKKKNWKINREAT